MKICPMVAELFNAEWRMDGRTDRRDETNSRFLQFCERAQTVSELIRKYQRNLFYVTQTSKFLNRIHLKKQKPC
jgi:hypothetical protein